MSNIEFANYGSDTGDQTINKQIELLQNQKKMLPCSCDENKCVLSRDCSRHLNGTKE